LSGGEQKHALFSAAHFLRAAVQRFQPALFRILPFVLASGLLAVYLETIAPGITWANAGSDGGDLIAAAATGGVAHPTGYPVYLLIARLFQLLPVGALAFRTNLLSAVSTALAAVFVFETVKHSLARSRPWESAVAAFVAALAFGLSTLAWSQAVITEVYALHIFFISLLINISTRWTSESQIKTWIIGLVQGLAIGNHLLSILMIPAVVATVCIHHRETVETNSLDRTHWRRDWRSFSLLSSGIVGGLLSYIVLPLRARAYPPVNWGNPVSLDRFAWLVSGRLYYGSVLQFDPASLWQHLQAWAGLTLDQFGFPGLVLAVVGVTVFVSPLRVYLLTIWAALVYTVFYLQYAVVDSIVYLLPVYLCMAIWIGLGLGHLTNLLSRPALSARILVGPACLVYLLVLASVNRPKVDASHDQRAEMFGNRVMTTAPARAILFAEGDRTLFTLWYFHYALRERPDLLVISNDMLPFDWYRENLRHVYPDLVLTESGTDLWLSRILRENSGRRACFPTELEATLNCQ
jgi:lipoprotein signal peptidase